MENENQYYTIYFAVFIRNDTIPKFMLELLDMKLQTQYAEARITLTFSKEIIND